MNSNCTDTQVSLTKGISPSNMAVSNITNSSSDYTIDTSEPRVLQNTVPQFHLELDIPLPKDSYKDGRSVPGNSESKKTKSKDKTKKSKDKTTKMKGPTPLKTEAKPIDPIVDARIKTIFTSTLELGDLAQQAIRDFSEYSSQVPMLGPIPFKTILAQNALKPNPEIAPFEAALTTGFKLAGDYYTIGSSVVRLKLDPYAPQLEQEVGTDNPSKTQDVFGLAIPILNPLLSSIHDYSNVNGLSRSYYLYRDDAAPKPFIAAAAIGYSLFKPAQQQRVIDTLLSTTSCQPEQIEWAGSEEHCNEVQSNGNATAWLTGSNDPVDETSTPDTALPASSEVTTTLNAVSLLSNNIRQATVANSSFALNLAFKDIPTEARIPISIGSTAALFGLQHLVADSVGTPLSPETSAANGFALTLGALQASFINNPNTAAAINQLNLTVFTNLNDGPLIASVLDTTLANGNNKIAPLGVGLITGITGSANLLAGFSYGNAMRIASPEEQVVLSATAATSGVVAVGSLLANNPSDERMWGLFGIKAALFGIATLAGATFHKKDRPQGHGPDLLEILGAQIDVNASAEGFQLTFSGKF